VFDFNIVYLKRVLAIHRGGSMKRLSYLYVLIIALNLPAAQLTVPKDFAKIQDAVDKVESGDTVFINDGIYHESITLKDSICLIGQSPLTTIIRGNKRVPVIKAGDKALIKNLTIDNGSKGILCENVIPTIQNCIIRDNKGTGIHCLVSLPDILNCLILSNDWTGIFCESTRSIKSSIQHNIVAENGYCGILLSGNSEVLIQNNVIIGNKQFGIYAEATSKKTRIIYNDFFSNRSNNNYFAIVDRSNIQENPQYPFVSGIVHNYYGAESATLKGKGKDGVTIGIINESDLVQFINDPDMDGVSGKNDLCKDIAEDIDNFQDQDGCPDFDNDNDGIYDTHDLCPDSAEDLDNNRDDDGCPDLDNDNDGILDTKDLCPANKETVNSFKDDDGCPDEAPIKGVNETENRSLKNNNPIQQKTPTGVPDTNKVICDPQSQKIDSTKTDSLKQSIPAK
jgi:parallel beta-helix repeat protein